LGSATWVDIVQSVVLTATIGVMLIQHLASMRHHRESMERIAESFESQVHERLISDLLELNRIMLDYPAEVKEAFEGLQNSSDALVRRNCYVYAVLDLLHYMVLHRQAVTPSVREHLHNLALLLYTEPAFREVFEEIKGVQSRELVEYLEREVAPLVGRKRQKQPKA